MEFISISSFLIMIRETMEAALIVGILLAYLTKTEQDRYKRDIWIGTGLAVFSSIIGAFLFQVLAGGFEGDSEKLFEGIVMVVAALVLTWMIIWMFKNSANMRHNLHKKIDVAIGKGRRVTIVSLAFIAVFREGVESVLFLSGISTNEPLSAVLFSGTLGIVVAVILAALLFRGSIELDIKRFFNTTSVILIFFAAGLFSVGIHEFQELDWFGAYSVTNSPSWNVPMWDWSGFLPATVPESGPTTASVIGSLLRALFGYQDNPTPLELFVYLIYWIIISITFFGINLKTRSQLDENPQAI